MQELPHKRGRGRPPTTFEHTAEKREARRLAREAERERENLELIRDKSVSPSQSRAHLRLERDEKKLQEKLKLAPTYDLVATVTEATSVVLKVADKSTNLKGQFVGEMRTAVKRIKAAASNVAVRAQPTTSDDLQDLVEEMREEISLLRGENACLKREAEENRKVEEAKRSSPTLLSSKSKGSKSPPLRSGRQRRRRKGSRVASPASSSDETEIMEVEPFPKEGIEMYPAVRGPPIRRTSDRKSVV